MKLKRIIIFITSILLSTISGCSSREHTFSNTYSYDDEHHWREATCGHDEVIDKENHQLSD